MVLNESEMKMMVCRIVVSISFDVRVFGDPPYDQRTSICKKIAIKNEVCLLSRVYFELRTTLEPLKVETYSAT